MKLVKYNGHGTYKLKFDCNDLLKKYKGLYLSETGVIAKDEDTTYHFCLLYTSPSPRDGLLSRMPSSA